MSLQKRRLQTWILLGFLGLLQLLLVLPVGAEPAVESVRLAQVDGAGKAWTDKLEPRYPAREPQEKPWYNSDLIFGISRSVTGSTLVPAAMVPLLLLTVPLDLALLPFAAIGGLFG